MTDESELKSENAAAISAGMLIGARDQKPLMLPDGGIAYVIPPNCQTEEYAPITPALPGFIKADPRFIERDSFCSYVNRFRKASTVIFAEPRFERMRALIDYHTAEADAAPASAAHNAHVATFDCGFDPNWAEWRKVDGKDLSQVDFAYFIERMLHTIGEPDGGDLLEMAQDLKVNRSVAFKQNVRIKNGAIDLQYEETDETSTKRAGTITVPDEITVVCPIFMLREPQAITVKLRYRIEKGAPLTFRLDVLNRSIIEFKAFKVMADEVADLTECPVYLG